MSVSHPLLKELKVHVLELRTQDDVIVKDDHTRLLPLCVCIESILRAGLRHVSSIVGVVKQDYWSWIDLLGKCRKGRLTLKTINFIDAVRGNEKLNTIQGKGRLFLRHALAYGLLGEVVEILVRDYDQISKDFYCTTSSCVANEILSEILLSLLFELKEVKFELKIQNCAFLDESWLLPVYRLYEFVPCMRLGVKIGYARGRFVSLVVEEDSVAAEDGKIEVGDIIDEINGVCASECGKGKLMSLFRQCKSQPLRVSVIKCHLDNGSVYMPLLPILTCLGLNKKVTVRKVKPSVPTNGDCDSLPDPFTNLLWSEPVLGSDENTKGSFQYLGKSFVGAVGSMSVIDAGLQKVLDTNTSPVDVRIEIGETHISTISTETNKVILKHNYTQVGSCGRRVDKPLHFCYVAGETVCNMAKEFHCHVFYGTKELEVKSALQNIALGFQRTHWAV